MASLLALALSPRARPYLLTALVVSFVLVTLHALPDFQFHSHTFQFPSLLPSKSTSSNDELLNTHLQELYSNLRQVCPLVPEPIYTEPGLTASQERRYAHLKSPRVWIKEAKTRARWRSKRLPFRGNGHEAKYILTTNIRQIEGQLPDLLNTLLTLTLFLGPQHLSFSFLEGPSDDCTPDAFESVLRPMLLNLGVKESQIHLVTRESKIDFANQNRIEVLAGLRNRALAPLLAAQGHSDTRGLEAASEVATDVAAVVFFNDVFLRASDVLELLHQHVMAGEKSGVETGITTGIDWYGKDPDYYYDIWVGRTVSGWRECSRYQTPSSIPG